MAAAAWGARVGAGSPNWMTKASTGAAGAAVGAAAAWGTTWAGVERRAIKRARPANPTPKRSTTAITAAATTCQRPTSGVTLSRPSADWRAPGGVTGWTVTR